MNRNYKFLIIFVFLLLFISIFVNYRYYLLLETNLRLDKVVNTCLKKVNPLLLNEYEYLSSDDNFSSEDASFLNTKIIEDKSYEE